LATSRTMSLNVQTHPRASEVSSSALHAKTAGREKSKQFCHYTKSVYKLAEVPSIRPDFLEIKVAIMILLICQIPHLVTMRMLHLVYAYLNKLRKEHNKQQAV